MKNYIRYAHVLFYKMYITKCRCSRKERAACCPGRPASLYPKEHILLLWHGKASMLKILEISK